MRRGSLVVALVGGALSAAAGAEPSAPTPYVGTWSVDVREGFKPARTARLVLRQTTGSWKEPRRPLDPCSGTTFPVTVQRSDRLQLEFIVRRQDTVTACPNLSFKAAPIDATTLVGGSGGRDDGHGHDHGHSHAGESAQPARVVLEIRMTKATGAGTRR